MIEFVIRIELEGRPSRETYDDLHRRLQNVGVLRSIRGANDHDTPLPDAMYSYRPNPDCSASVIYDLLKPHIAATGHRYKLLVVKASDWIITSIPWEI